MSGLLSGTNCYSFHPSVPLPTPRISPPGRPTAGELFSLTCTVIVTVGDSLIDVQWTGPDGAVISSSIRQSLMMTDDCTMTYTSTLELSPVKTCHDGLYACQVTSTAGRVTANETLIVQSELWMCLLLKMLLDLYNY